VSAVVTQDHGAPSPALGRRRIHDLVANPWGRPRFLWAYALFFVAWTLIPIALAILFSFNPGRALSAFQGFSLRWYFGDPNESVLHDPALRRSVVQSLKLAVGTALLTVPLGVSFAVGMDRWKGRGSGTTDFLMMFSFVVPELIVAVALFLVFTKSFTVVGLGTNAQLLGMIVLSIAFVVVIVRARLLSLGREYEEVAMDLGASPFQALRRVLLPLLLPAILACTAMLFVFTLDDFVIANTLSRDVATETISVKIWAARGTPTPVVNALGSTMLFVTLIVVVLAYLLFRRLTRGESGEKGVGLPIA